MYEDYIGKRYGRLVITSVYLKEQRNGKHVARAVCKCACGTVKEISLSHLKNGATTSCGCYQREIVKSSATDYTGQKFGRWTVIRRDETKSRTHWVCRCECGTIKSVTINNIKYGNSKSCGCLQKELSADRYTKDEVGNRFGRLVAVELIRKPKADGNGNVVYYRCKCDCGNETVVWGPHLRNNSIQSCGCYHRERVSETFITHGLSSTKAYNRWRSRKRKELENIYDSEWTLEMEQYLRHLFQECVLCGITNKEHIEKYGHPLHVDHVTPLHAGNGLKPGNATILCVSCNASKGAKSLSDLSEYEQNRLVITAELFELLWSGMEL